MCCISKHDALVPPSIGDKSRSRRNRAQQGVDICVVVRTRMNSKDKIRDYISWGCDSSDLPMKGSPNDIRRLTYLGYVSRAPEAPDETFGCLLNPKIMAMNDMGCVKDYNRSSRL